MQKKFFEFKKCILPECAKKVRSIYGRVFYENSLLKNTRTCFKIHLFLLLKQNELV